MEKELKNYLHLYLGCKITCTNEECSSDNEYFNMVLKVSPLLLDKFSNGNWKIILRPLSDKTEDEAIEVFKMASLFDLSECKFDFGDNYEWINANLNGKVIDAIKFVGDNIEMMNNDGSFSAINPISPIINWYRKNSFDCDGLIDAGLAIDKTKINP